MTIPADAQREALELIAANRFIVAVKVIRTATGCSLQEGKDAMNALRYGAEIPTGD